MPIALVTGGNRGIGLETARQLAKRGWSVIVTVRDLSDAPDIGRAMLLDLSKPATATALAEELPELDALVNNGAHSLRGFDAKVAEKTLAVNLFGTLTVTGAVAPKIRDGGTIVMVSSEMGSLSGFGEPARSKILAAESRRDVDALSTEFVQGVAKGTHSAAGWPSNAYAVSKALLNAATRVLAKETPRLRVNAVTPGWVKTDLGGPRAPRELPEGGASVVAAVMEKATGGFFRDGRSLPW